jgi:hypothetical protein
MSLPVYLGYDHREPQSYSVAISSLLRHASEPVHVTPLNIHKLAETGLLRRPQDTRGQRYDIISNAAASTEFAISRFLVPILAQTGWALFADSDVVFLGDVAELFRQARPEYAVMVVKHDQEPDGRDKMDGQRQLAYGRKNWSSVILWNCDHPANKRLSLGDVQERRGLDLHQFYWLHDAEIGELPREWNWLVDVQEKPQAPKIAHFTLGTPEVGVLSDHSQLWLEAQ